MNSLISSYKFFASVVCQILCHSFELRITMDSKPLIIISLIFMMVANIGAFRLWRWNSDTDSDQEPEPSAGWFGVELNKLWRTSFLQRQNNNYDTFNSYWWQLTKAERIHYDQIDVLITRKLTGRPNPLMIQNRVSQKYAFWVNSRRAWKSFKLQPCSESLLRRQPN